jgi:hypothetical protein
MSISHIKSNTIADFTGTVTVFDSQGSTATAAATNLVRPGDWNSAHAEQWVISGNTSGTSSHSGTNFVFGFTGDMTGSLSTVANAATLWFSEAGRYVSEYRPYAPAVQQAFQYGQSTMHVWPVDIPVDVTCNYIGIPLIYSAASNSSNSQTISLTFALYTRNSQSFGSIISTSYTTAMSASGSVGTNGAAFVGNRELRIAWSTSVSAGRYYQAFLSKTASNAGGVTISNVGASNWASAYSGPFGVASNASQQWYEAAGILSAQTAAIPATFNASDLVGSTSVQQRPQIWRMMWNTY